MNSEDAIKERNASDFNDQYRDPSLLILSPVWNNNVKTKNRQDKSRQTKR